MDDRLAAAMQSPIAEASVRLLLDRFALRDLTAAGVGDRLAASHYHLSSTVSALAIGMAWLWQRQAEAIDG
jgi:hypothetical protein